MRMDDVPPRILRKDPDTVHGTVARIRIPYRDESDVKVSVEPRIGTRLSVFDSFVVLEARDLAPGAHSWKATFTDEAGNASTMAVHAFRMAGVPDPQVAPGGLDSQVPAGDTTKNDRNGTVSKPATVAIHVIRYRMEPDENIRAVARKFYGVKEMDAILVRWNGLENARSSIPGAAAIEIPMWKGFEYGRVDPADALEHFPWEDAPGRRRTRQ
ncbi:MAG: hypothetical protein AAB214_01580 [Fibrobacterota bacterium]